MNIFGPCCWNDVDYFNSHMLIYVNVLIYVACFEKDNIYIIFFNV